MDLSAYVNVLNEAPRSGKVFIFMHRVDTGFECSTMNETGTCCRSRINTLPIHSLRAANGKSIRL